MKITFQEHGNGASAVLVAQAHAGVGVWYGPHAASASAARLVDRKYPIDADAAVLRSMRNASGQYRFSAHFEAADAAAAAWMALLWPRSLPLGNGALVFDAGSGAYTLISDCMIANVEIPETIGCYVLCAYTIEF